MVLANTGEDPATEWDRMLTLQTLRCDGCVLILAPDGPDEPVRRKRLAELGLPVVYIDRAPPFPADAVLTDNQRITADAVKYLIGLGHKRIAILESMLFHARTVVSPVPRARCRKGCAPGVCAARGRSRPLISTPDPRTLRP